MPQRQLSEDEFNAVRNRVLDSLPPGLSEQDFERTFNPAFEMALAQEEGKATIGTDPMRYLGETLSNVPGSALRMGKNASDGGKSLLSMLGGATAEIGTNTGARAREIVGLEPNYTEGTPNLSRLGDTATGIVPGVVSMIRDRYGSLGAAERTLRDDPVGAVADVAGVVSGASTARNAIVNPALRATGSGVYRAGAALTPPHIKREFANLGRSGFREEIPFTAAGAEKAKNLGIASADEADALVANRAAQTTSFRGRSNPAASNPGFVSFDEDIFPDVRALAHDVRGGELGVADPSIQQLAKLTERTRLGHQWPMDLNTAQAMKRASQERAHSIFRAGDRGAHVPASTQTRGQYAKAVSTGTQRKIEAEVPAVAPVNARTQEAMGLERGALAASDSNHIPVRLLSALGLSTISGGDPLMAAMLAGTGAVLGSPQGLTTGGLALKRLGTSTPMMPAATRAALIAQMLARHENDR